MKIEITDRIKQNIRALAEKYGLTLVVLFGSQASGKTHRESDVDIAYKPSRPLSSEEESMLNYELTPVFRTNSIDTTNLSYAPPLLQRRIVDEAVVLYDQTGHEYSAFEVAAIRRYVEAKPLFAIRREKLDAFLGTPQRV